MILAVLLALCSLMLAFLFYAVVLSDDETVRRGDEHTSEEAPIFETVEPSSNNQKPTDAAKTEEPQLTEEELRQQALEESVRGKLSAMTREEKVAQLFFVTPESITGVEQVLRCGDTMKAALARYPVGGIILFAQNLQSEEQARALLSGIAQYSEETQGLQMFLGVDEEGGKVARIGNNDAFQVEKIGSMQSLAASGDEETAFTAGKTIGSYLHRIGFNLDFAPVADVLTNPSNSIIGNRSFGSDAEVVSNMAAAYAGGLRSENVIPVYKHFPGHGGTREDSHKEYAYSTKDKTGLYEAELVPFRSAAEEGIECIMVGHISVPAITGDDTPATLSQELVEGILREELGYEGVVITDAMAMGAISEHYSSGDAAIRAINAGCDMILMPADFQSAYSAVLNALDSGALSEERIDASVYRILELKLRHST